MKDSILLIGEFSRDFSNENYLEKINLFLADSTWAKIIYKDHDLDEHVIEERNNLLNLKSKLNTIHVIKCVNSNSDEVSFVFQKAHNDAKISFKNFDFKIPDRINVFTNNLKYFYINSSIDIGSQNSKELEMWDYYGLQVPSYATLESAFDYDNPDLKQIEIESLPGHTHNISYGDQLRFDVCYQMYFSDIYYKYIPKPLFDNFKDCEENIILENGLRKITLYKDVKDFSNPVNKARQFAFRKQLGIDTIAHELQDWQQVDMELPVVITQLNCEKGKTKVTRYLSKENQLVSPSLAETKEIKEYLEDGITVVLEKIEKLK